MPNPLNPEVLGQAMNAFQKAFDATGQTEPVSSRMYKAMALLPTEVVGVLLGASHEFQAAALARLGILGEYDNARFEKESDDA